MPKYTIRAYAIITSTSGDILLLKETFGDRTFTKFPGGGLEENEGVLDALHRELHEELGLALQEVEHFYTTDFFVESSFHLNTQVISVYYKLTEPIDENKIHLQDGDSKLLSLKWVSKSELKTTDVTFPIDKKVVDLLTS